MTFDATILTLFPEMFPGPLGYSLTGRALEQGIWSLDAINIRDFGIGAHKTVDDTPYGGGAGMVMRADVLHDAIEAAKAHKPDAQLVYLTPRGVPFTQKLAVELIASQHMTLLCGRYEGVDERVLEYHQPLEISLGDFVMTGGELAAMAMLDTCVRLLPGVIGEADSLAQESFGLDENYACLLEHPHYTKPPCWQEKTVPEVLRSGHHAAIAQWRMQQSQATTKQRRPDLWQRYERQHNDKTKEPNHGSDSNA